MSFDDFDFALSGSDPVRVEISRHAHDQWRDRLPGHLLSSHPLSRRTWRTGEVVIAPEADCDETRLVRIPSGRDMLLCGHHHPDRTVVATVLYAHHDRLWRP